MKEYASGLEEKFKFLRLVSNRSLSSLMWVKIQESNVQIIEECFDQEDTLKGFLINCEV